MKNSRPRLQAFILSVLCMLSMSACRQESNTEGNPEVGAATGSAVQGEIQSHKEGTVSPDTTVVPSPAGDVRTVPTVPEGHRMLNHEEFMKNCEKGCSANRQQDSQFCQRYCHCSYEEMSAQVPIDDLRAFARNQQSLSDKKISGILQQCSNRSKSPGASGSGH